MSKVIVVGHGGYGSAMKRNLAMLVGELEGFFFLDFNESDSLEDLQAKLDQTLAFRVTAMLCAEHADWAVVAGMNTSALSEVSFNLELPARELAQMACEVTRETILMYPPQE